MKRYNYLFTIIMVLLTSFSSCKDSLDLFDDYSDKEPVVITDSIYQYAQDTFALVGHIEAEGASPIEVAGFCYDFYTTPSVVKNQILFGAVKGSYSTLITGLIEDTTYYFATFAANKYGSVRGNEIAYKVPNSGPPNVPCTLPVDTLIDNEFNYPIYNVLAGNGEAKYLNDYGMKVGVYTFGGYCTYYIGFNGRPSSGVYTINKFLNGKKDKRSVMMKLLFSSTDYDVSDGGKIYVEELGKYSGRYKVSFCDLTYEIGSDFYGLKGSFITP